MKTTARKRIRKIAHALQNEIRKLNMRQVKAMKKRCLAMTETNCWHMEYKMKTAIINALDSHVVFLKFKKMVPKKPLTNHAPKD